MRNGTSPGNWPGSPTRSPSLPSCLMSLLVFLSLAESFPSPSRALLARDPMHVEDYPEVFDQPDSVPGAHRPDRGGWKEAGISGGVAAGCLVGCWPTHTQFLATPAEAQGHKELTQA